MRLSWLPAWLGIAAAWISLPAAGQEERGTPAFRAVDEGPPEYGRGVSPREAEAGWIALFDGETDFGWSGAKASEGLLSGGATTSEFGPCELRAVVERAGTITVGGEDYP